MIISQINHHQPSYPSQSTDSWDVPQISSGYPQHLISSASGLAKSANKHNRLYLKAEPLDGELVQAIEQGQVGPKADCKEAAKLLTSKFGWDKQVP